ncbi:MAG: FHA domain-containing protein [Bacillota bacterium]
MLDFVLTVFRYIFLILLYVFIFQLIRMMFRDLKPREPVREAGGKKPAGQAAAGLAQLAAAPLPGAPAGLVVLSSGDPGLPPGTVFPLKTGEEATLGRGSRNTITMVEPFASMEHAAVFGQDGQFRLEDRGSKNGTYLNDVRINKPTVLADGDRIRIGDITMQFVRWAYEVESGDRSGARKEAKRG